MSDAAENHGSPVEPGDSSTFTPPSRNDTAGSVVTTALDPNESQPARQRRRRQERREREQRARQRVDAEVAQLLLENKDGRYAFQLMGHSMATAFYQLNTNEFVESTIHSVSSVNSNFATESRHVSNV